MDRLLLRVPEAAEVLGISRSKAYEMIAAGELPCIRLRGSVRVPLEALRRWIEGQEDVTAESESAKASRHVGEKRNGRPTKFGGPYYG